MRMKSLFVALPLCLALVAIVSCGKEDKSATATSSTPAAIDQQGQSNFQIVQYGPNESSAGVAFNTQSSGQAALWVKLDHPVSGSNAAIWWGDHRLESTVSGNVASAVVPAELYAVAGKYPLQFRVGTGTNDKSNIVYFVVK